jgi:hypothetical protein
MSERYEPTTADTSDSDHIILSKILDAVSGTSVGWDNQAFTNDSNGKPTQIITSSKGRILETLTITRDGNGNITNIKRS